MKEIELESSARSEFFKGTKAKLDVLQAVQKRVHMPCLEVVAVTVESCRLSVVVLEGVAQGQLRTVACHRHKFLHLRERHENVWVLC